MAYNFQGIGIYTTEQPLCPSDILKKLGSKCLFTCQPKLKIYRMPGFQLKFLFQSSWFFSLGTK